MNKNGTDSMLAGAIQHEVAMLNDILHRDVGTCNDFPQRDGNAYFSTGLTAFLVANRLHEQLLKLTTPEIKP